MRFRIFVRICTGWCFTMSSISLGSLSVLPNGEQTVYCWGSQCFLSVSALTGMLCPLRWACLRSCLPPCLPSGLGCCVRLAGLPPVLSPNLSPIWSEMLCPPPWSCLSLLSGLVSQLLSLFCLVACLSSGMLCLPPPGLVFFLSLVLSPSLSPIWSGMLCSPSWLVSQPSLSPVFCPILFSSWSGVPVLWACHQNFMCDLCNCLGSTVV